MCTDIRALFFSAFAGQNVARDRQVEKKRSYLIVEHGAGVVDVICWTFKQWYIMAHPSLHYCQIYTAGFQKRFHSCTVIGAFYND